MTVKGLVDLSCNDIFSKYTILWQKARIFDIGILYTCVRNFQICNVTQSHYISALSSRNKFGLSRGYYFFLYLTLFYSVGILKKNISRF